MGARPSCQGFLLQGTKEEVGKGWSTSGSHGHSFDLVEEIIVEAEGVVPDDDLQQISGEVFDRLVSSLRWCGGENTLQDHFNPNGLWNGKVEGFYIQGDQSDVGVR